MSSEQAQFNSNVDEDILYLRSLADGSSHNSEQTGEGIGRVFSKFKMQLERVVEFRMDPRIRARVDANDVLQEAFLDIKSRYREFIAEPAVSLFVWMRQLTLQVLIEFQRRHFRQKRNVQKEVRISFQNPGS